MPLIRWKGRTTADLLSAMAIIAPLAQAYSPPVIVPLMVLGCLLPLIRRRHGLLERSWTSFRWLIPCLGSLVFYGAGTSLWAVNPTWSLIVAARLLGIFLCCIVLAEAANSLDGAERSQVGRSLLLGFGLNLANLEFILLCDGSPISWLQDALKPLIGQQRPVIMPARLDTSMVFVGLLLWPCLAGVGRFRAPLGAMLYAAGFLVILQGVSTTAAIAYLAGGAVFLSGWLLPRLTCWGLAGATALWTVLAPFALRPALTGTLSRLAGSKSGSWEHRRAIWDFVIRRISERPIAGWGLGNSRFIPGGQTEFAPGLALLPLHPHDAALQLWLELGGIGVLLAVAFLLGVFHAIDRLIADRRQRAHCLALTSVAIINSMVSFSIWQEWWLTFIILSAVFLIAARRPSVETTLPTIQDSAGARPSSRKEPVTGQAKLSALVVVHNEECRLAACLERLSFADEIVVVLDRCSDGSAEIARHFSARLVEGGWETEADRRNTGIDACRGDWILEVDADERVSPALAAEIGDIVRRSAFDRHLIPVDNYIGDTLVRYGWGGSFGKGAYHGLFRKGAKRWGEGRVHPKIHLSGRQGATLSHPVDHLVDRNISDMIRRLDSYSTARAQDLRDHGDPDSTRTYIRRFFGRIYKCYIHHHGYREGDWGLLIAICAGLYPLLSHLKAKLEPNPPTGSSP